MAAGERATDGAAPGGGERTFHVEILVSPALPALPWRGRVEVARGVIRLLGSAVLGTGLSLAEVRSVKKQRHQLMLCLSEAGPMGPHHMLSFLDAAGVASESERERAREALRVAQGEATAGSAPAAAAASASAASAASSGEGERRGVKRAREEGLEAWEASDANRGRQKGLPSVAPLFRRSQERKAEQLLYTEKVMVMRRDPSVMDAFREFVRQGDLKEEVFWALYLRARARREERELDHLRRALEAGDTTRARMIREGRAVMLVRDGDVLGAEEGDIGAGLLSGEKCASAATDFFKRYALGLVASSVAHAPSLDEDTPSQARRVPDALSLWATEAESIRAPKLASNLPLSTPPTSTEALLSVSRGSGYGTGELARAYMPDDVHTFGKAARGVAEAVAERELVVRRIAASVNSHAGNVLQLVAPHRGPLLAASDAWDLVANDLRAPTSTKVALVRHDDQARDGDGAASAAAAASAASAAAERGGGGLQARSGPEPAHTLPNASALIGADALVVALLVAKESLDVQMRAASAAFEATARDARGLPRDLTAPERDHVALTAARAAELCREAWHTAVPSSISLPQRKRTQASSSAAEPVAVRLRALDEKIRLESASLPPARAPTVAPLLDAVRSSIAHTLQRVAPM